MFWPFSEISAASTSETSVNFYQTTRRKNPEDSHFLLWPPSLNYYIHWQQSIDIHTYIHMYKTLRYVSIQGSTVSGSQERNRTY
jgi:hypothetical protein